MPIGVGRRIDYKELQVLAHQNFKKFVAECSRLARLNPTWDWQRTPRASHDVVEAHNIVWRYLQSQPVFTQLLHSLKNKPKPVQFIERWRQRGALQPVTSDHILIINQFQLLSPYTQQIELQLSVGSWNLMNKAHSKANCRQKNPITGEGLYANTPEIDLDEEDADYIARKKEQFKQMFAEIDNATVSDAIVLQEIDFLTNSHFSMLKQEFEQGLKARGFDVVISQPPTKPQAVVYNQKTLMLDPKAPPQGLIAGTAVGGNDARQTLFEVNFKHRATQQKVCLASVHLDFEGDYSTALRDYSAKKARGGSMVIWGGDTNHAPGHKIQGLTGSFEHATNYDAADIGYSAHHHGTNKAKAYDGFGFCPPSGKIMTSTELAGQRFFVEPTTKQVELRPFTPTHPYHRSLPGQPWLRRQTLVLDVLAYRAKIWQQIESQLRSQLSALSYTKSKAYFDGLEEVKQINQYLSQLAQDVPEIVVAPALALVAEALTLVNDEQRLAEQFSNKPYQEGLKQQFITKYTNAMSGFRFFRTFGLEHKLGNASFEQIIQHAQGQSPGFSGDRSFKILKSLGVLDEQRQLTENYQLQMQQLPEPEYIPKLP